MYYVVRKDLILEFQHCESTLIDKDAMALKVFLLVIFLINFVKYTCLRRKNSKTMRPTASHRVKNITNNETIFPGKLGTVWKRIMSNIINTKLKFTKKHISAF